MAYSRKKSREIVFRLLFKLSYDRAATQENCLIDGEDLAAVCDNDELPVGPELEYIEMVYKAVIENLSEIDKIITEHAKGFSFDRIFKTDLTALRMGIAEVKYTDVPAVVAVNAAVEIAKKYGTEKSGGFVNGILAEVIK